MAKLQIELKKKRPFESLEQEATLNLSRTNDQIQIRFSRLFREHGLTPSHYNILRILRGEGAPMPILEIGHRTISAVPGITGLIDRMEQAGLVSRCRCDEDRRVVKVSITDAGSKLLQRLDKPVQALHRQVMSKLSQTELKTLNSLLEKVRDSLGETAGGKDDAKAGAAADL